jgi:hypothetical protein
MEGNNRLFIAAGVLAALAGGVWYVNREKPEERQERLSDPWTAIQRDQVTRFTIDPAGDPPALEFEKRDNKWFMNQPGRGPADDSQITSMLSSLADMHVASVAAQEAGSHAGMEVDSAHAIHVQVFRGSTKLFDGWVGKDLDGGTAVRFEGNTRVYRVSGLERFRLQNAPREWRNRQITNVERSHVRWVQWQDATGTYRFDRNNDTWTGAATNPAIERLDTARVNQLVTNLIALNATDFAAENASTGINDQSARFTIDVDNGPQVVLRVGSNSGDDGVFVKRDDSDIVFVAARSGASAIDFDPTAVQTPLPPEGGVGDASAPPEPPGGGMPPGMPMGMPMGMPGGPGGPGGAPQISPEIMRQIQQQIQQQAAARGAGGGAH